MKKKGFTLTEIVVAVTISIIIMGWVLRFLVKLQSDLTISRQSTSVYVNLTDFFGTMNNLTKLYSSGNVIVSGTGMYNVELLTRPDKSGWALIGVVEQKDGNLSKLDPPSNKSTYGKKVMAYQKLNASQITTLLVSTGSIYDIVFQDEWLFKDLLLNDLYITPYNSGSLFEYKFIVEAPFYEQLRGQSRNNIDADVVTFPFTLDF